MQLVKAGYIVFADAGRGERRELPDQGAEMEDPGRSPHRAEQCDQPGAVADRDVDLGLMRLDHIDSCSFCTPG